MKALSLLLCLLCLVAALRASTGTGTFSGSMGITGTWSVVGDTLTVNGQFTSDYNGDQISFGIKRLDGGSSDVSGPQATGPSQVHTFALSRSTVGAETNTARLRIFSTNNGTVSTYVRALVEFEWSAASTDCQASVNVTNPYGVPTWFRVVHSIDGELGRVLLQPGQNWTTSWEVTCGGNFVLAYQPTGEETDDVWFIPENPEDPGEPSEDPSDWSPTGPPTDDQPPESPAPKPPAPPPPSEAGVPAPKKDKGWLPPWKAREDNEDLSNLLDRDTYREGVENIIGSLSDEGPVTVVEDENPTPTDERVADAKETVVSFGAALITLREEVTDSLPSVSGSVSTSSTLSATLPSITLLGMTWPAQTWSYDFSDHSGAIGALRSLLLGVLGITYYFAFVRALRGSVPSMSRDAASALPESKVDPITGINRWDK